MINEFWAIPEGPERDRIREFEAKLPKRAGPWKPYPWAWSCFSENAKPCPLCGDPTTALYGRNPERIPEDETRMVQGSLTGRDADGRITSYETFGPPVLVDKVGACLSCVPADEVANNPHFYAD